MSKDTYDFSDLDAILAEFRDEGTAEEVPILEEPVSSAPEAAYTVGNELPREDSPFAPVNSEATMRYDLPPIYAREEENERRAAQKSRFVKAKEDAEEISGEEAEEGSQKKKHRLGRKAKKEQPLPEAAEAAAEEKPKKAPKPPRVYTKKRIPWDYHTVEWYDHKKLTDRDCWIPRARLKPDFEIFASALDYGENE